MYTPYEVLLNYKGEHKFCTIVTINLEHLVLSTILTQVLI